MQKCITRLISASKSIFLRSRTHLKRRKGRMGERWLTFALGRCLLWSPCSSDSGGSDEEQ